MKMYKKIISILVLIALVVTLFPSSIYATGSYSASLSSTTINVGSSTNVNITAVKSAGKFTVTTSNSSVATVSSASVFVDGLDGTKTNSGITVKGVSAGTATITITPVDVSDDVYNLLSSPTSIKVTVKAQSTNTNTNNTGSSTSGKTNTTTNNTKEVEKDTDKEKKSSDATLKDITLKNGSIDFKSDVTKYTVDVDKSVSSLGLKATAGDSKAGVKISGDENFKAGENIVTITVTAEDGTTKTYEIKVIKSKYGSGPLIDLKVKGYEFNKEFDPSQHEYSVDVVNVDSVDIEYKLTNDTSKAEITGADNLKVGLNKIEVKVIEKDGTVTIYTINVNNAVSSLNIIEKNNNIWIIIIIILSILLVIETIYIIIKNRKEKR